MHSDNAGTSLDTQQESVETTLSLPEDLRFACMWQTSLLGQADDAALFPANSLPITQRFSSAKRCLQKEIQAKFIIKRIHEKSNMSVERSELPDMSLQEFTSNRSRKQTRGHQTKFCVFATSEQACPGVHCAVDKEDVLSTTSGYNRTEESRCDCGIKSSGYFGGMVGFAVLLELLI